MIIAVAASTLSNVTSTYKPKHRTVTSLVSSSAPISSPSTIPTSGIRPTENNSVGGLSAGSPGKKNGK